MNQGGQVTSFVYPTGSCGMMGPRVTAYYQDFSMQDFSRYRSASFLNEVTGRTISNRTISQEVEFQIVDKLKDVLILGDEDTYKYIGPEITYEDNDWHNYGDRDRVDEILIVSRDGDRVDEMLIVSTDGTYRIK